MTKVPTVVWAGLGDIQAVQPMPGGEGSHDTARHSSTPRLSAHLHHRDTGVQEVPQSGATPGCHWLW